MPKQANWGCQVMPTGLNKRNFCLFFCECTRTLFQFSKTIPLLIFSISVCVVKTGYNFIKVEAAAFTASNFRGIFFPHFCLGFIFSLHCDFAVESTKKTYLINNSFGILHVKREGYAYVFSFLLRIFFMCAKIKFETFEDI